MIKPVKKPKEQPLLIRCDRCTKVFVIAHRIKPVAQGELRYFTCPQCDKEYPYAIENEHTLEARNLYAEIRKSFLHGGTSLEEVETARKHSKLICDQELQAYVDSQKKL